MSAGGILPVFASCIRAISHRDPIAVETYRKFLNWERKRVDSSNRDKVAHLCDLLNALNGHPSERSVAQGVDWWRWLFTATSLCREEVMSRVYTCVLWPTELVVASLALFLPQLADIRPLVPARMKAWLGLLLPATFRRAPRRIENERVGEPGLISAPGPRQPGEGWTWIGIGDRSMVMNRSAGSDERAYLDQNPVGQWLPVVLGQNFPGREDSHAKQFLAALKRRGGDLWRPEGADLTTAIAATDGLAGALATVWGWLAASPLPEHPFEVARQMGSTGHILFEHTKSGSTGGGSGAGTTPDEDWWISALNAEREGRGGADDVAPCTAEIRPRADGGRELACWRDDTPGRVYSKRLADAPDAFRASAGPDGYRIEVPTTAQPTPPTTPTQPMPPTGSGGGGSKPRRRGGKGCAVPLATLIGALAAAAAWAVRP